MMKHEMKLKASPFNKIKNETKTVEIRLYDEKRKKINIGDEICFTNMITGEVIHTIVLNINIFNNFTELYNNFDKIELGYDENEIASPMDMEAYYSKEEQSKYGVVGIKIKLKAK